MLRDRKRLLNLGAIDVLNKSASSLVPEHINDSQGFFGRKNSNQMESVRFIRKMRYISDVPLETQKTAKLGAKERKEKKSREKEKKRKEKQHIEDNNKKVENYTPPWADLPDLIVNAINHNWWLKLTVYNGGISKMWWRASPRSCSSTTAQPPSLVLHNHEISTALPPVHQHTHAFFILTFDASHELGFTLLGWRHGFCNGNYNGISKDCTPVVLNSSSNEQFKFTNAVAYGGKYYALSLQGTLAIIDIDDPREEIRATMSIPAGVKRAIPSTCSKGFREYLVKSCGEILLVLLVSKRSMNVVDDVEVFRLDLNRKDGWIKIESLDDRTLFLGRNCWMCLPDSEFLFRFPQRKKQEFNFEYRKNCIYFRIGAGSWVFDVGSRSISPA